MVIHVQPCVDLQASLFDEWWSGDILIVSTIKEGWVVCHSEGVGFSRHSGSFSSSHACRSEGKVFPDTSYVPLPRWQPIHNAFTCRHASSIARRRWRAQWGRGPQYSQGVCSGSQPVSQDLSLMGFTSWSSWIWFISEISEVHQSLGLLSAISVSGRQHLSSLREEILMYQKEKAWGFFSPQGDPTDFYIIYLHYNFSSVSWILCEYPLLQLTASVLSLWLTSFLSQTP